ncbi:MAG: cytoplasmic [Planctomycetota bacterium]|nr:MAG: cytoplasmic [Planctomycetota bacterium]
MLPDSVAKRDLLWAEHKTPPNYAQYGEQFLKEGWLADAAEFFGRADSEPKLREVMKLAIREGDASLVGRLAQIRAGLVATSDWSECAREAERLEKWSYARAAWEKAGDAGKAAAAQAKALVALGYTIQKAVTNESGAAGDRPAP